MTQNEPTQTSTRSQQETHLLQLQQQLAETPATHKAARARLLLDIANYQLGLQRHEPAWQSARMVVDEFIALEQFQLAAETCNVLYQCEQAASLVALAHGTWLAVTYPVDPELSIALLQHIIEETPDHSDGAAVAAMSAHYIAGLRAPDEKMHENLQFISTQLIAQVARRHSQVTTQHQLDAWMDRLSLRDPSVFLPRLSQVLQVMVGEHWWFDRDALRAKLPT